MAAITERESTPLGIDDRHARARAEMARRAVEIPGVSALLAAKTLTLYVPSLRGAVAEAIFDLEIQIRHEFPDVDLNLDVGTREPEATLREG